MQAAHVKPVLFIVCPMCLPQAPYIAIIIKGWLQHEQKWMVEAR